MFFPKRHEQHFIVAKDHEGKLPAALDGLYTSHRDATRAIELFQASVRAKAKPTKRRTVNAEK